jgi:acetyl esterase/lipase
MKGVWIQPVPELILGRVQEWASNAKIEAIQIPGYWLHKIGEDVTPNAPPSPGEKVVMALHGGAYVGMSANPDDHTSNIAKGILEYVHTVKRVFSVEYRLSKGPPFESANPFPAALVDALAGYNYLVNVVGFDPRDIILEGDSAGGNLVLALARYLVEYTGELQNVATKTGVKPLAPPAGLILLSPWPDLGTSHDRNPPSYLAKSDYVGNVRGPRAKYAQTAFTGSIGLAGADMNVYISPASKSIKDVSFAGWPRTFLVCGGAEYLVPAIGTLKERMAAHMGEGTGPGQVYYHEQPDAVHDYLCFPWHEPERSATLKAIAEWC